MQQALVTLLAMPSSLIALLTSLLPLATPQFIYPPNVPSDKTLSDYTTSNTPPITSWKIHDAIIGSYSTPKPAFTITRCAHPGLKGPILPSTGSFNSTVGRIADDGTWQVMDSYGNGMFPNVYSADHNLWVISDFEQFVGNDTTGHICWWELYSVSEKRVDYGYWDANNTYHQDLRREVTLLGDDTSNYFASTPFVVNTTMRAGNRNYTWTNSGGGDNSASKTTISVGNRPTGNAAVGLRDIRMVKTGGLGAVMMSFLGILLGLVA